MNNVNSKRAAEYSALQQTKNTSTKQKDVTSNILCISITVTLQTDNSYKYQGKGKVVPVL
jgi:hypothetical protein